jgi:hypothetical protein
MSENRLNEILKVKLFCKDHLQQTFFDLHSSTIEKFYAMSEYCLDTNTGDQTFATDILSLRNVGWTCDKLKGGCYLAHKNNKNNKYYLTRKECVLNCASTFTEGGYNQFKFLDDKSILDLLKMGVPPNNNVLLRDLYKISDIIKLNNVPSNFFTSIIVYTEKEYNLVRNNLDKLSKLTSLTFSPDFNHTDFNMEDLPESLTHITLGDNFNESLPKNIPKGLTHITFGYDFNQPFQRGELPKGLTHLTFGRNFNKPLLELPKGLTHLTFGYDFNQPFQRGELPKGLTHLTFGSNFNEPLLGLPKGLTHLTFGSNFNEPLLELPKGLTHLTFGLRFNRPLPKKLPDSLIYLTFGDLFNQHFLQRLPDDLTHLTLGRMFNYRLPRLIEGLTHLTLGKEYNKPLLKLPESLTHLILGEEFNLPLPPLPESLTHLTLGDNFNQQLPVILPKSLTHLTIGFRFDHSLPELPERIEQLILVSYNKKRNMFYNDQEAILHFSYRKSNKIKYLPNIQKLRYLTHLELPGHFSNESVIELPKNLTHLTLGEEFDQPLPKFPKLLTYLKFKSITFTNKLLPSLPEYLNYLEFEHSLKMNFNKKDRFPEGLKSITVAGKVYTT